MRRMLSVSGKYLTTRSIAYPIPRRTGLGSFSDTTDHIPHRRPLPSSCRCLRGGCPAGQASRPRVKGPRPIADLGEFSGNLHLKRPFPAGGLFLCHAAVTKGGENSGKVSIQTFHPDRDRT